MWCPRRLYASHIGRSAEYVNNGLLLVEQRVQDAGGTLQVTSTVGRGTKVVMRLPLAGPGVSGPLAR